MAEHKVVGGKIQLSVVTPEGTVFSGAVDLVVVPGHDGEVAFLPGHAPYVGLLGDGELRFHEGSGGTRHYFLAGGVVQVVDDRIAIVAEKVTPAASLDASMAQAEIEAASKLPVATEAETRTRDAALRLARAKLAVARRAGPGAAAAGGARH